MTVYWLLLSTDTRQNITYNERSWSGNKQLKQRCNKKQNSHNGNTYSAAELKPSPVLPCTLHIFGKQTNVKHTSKNKA